MRIGPQPGPQEQFLSSSADIVIFGGAAGGGKTFGLLLEPMRHINNPKFGAVIFRRTSPQIRNEGALWDESEQLYPHVGAKPRESVLEWDFPRGATLKFAHMQHEKDKYDWQGSQIPLIGFDEITHFTRSQFFYMLSRNRSTCGVRPYIRATCNPDADSWVAEFIAWWIDPETGYPIPERAGVIRWFIVLNDTVVWGDSREELLAKYAREDLPEDAPEQPRPKSFTFIPSTVYDNKELLKADPGYLANLQALNTVERERLLGGNWKIRAAAGLYFSREQVQIIDVAPAGLNWVRYWDLAATEKRDDNDPDWTVGVKMARDPMGLIYIAHVVRMREGPRAVRQALLNTASADGLGTRIGLPQDPGQAGKDQAADLVALLSGYDARTRPETGDKIVRFGPFSAQAQAGNVRVVRGPWNDAFFTALENFPEGHDDDADASAGAYDMVINEKQSMPFGSLGGS